MFKTTGNAKIRPVLEPLPSNTVVLNPLKIFPAKNDTITGAFFGVEAPRHAREIEARTKWLNPESIDPQFGIKGDSQEIYIRRTFRRMESSNIFQPLRHDEASLAELGKPAATTNKKFVLVEESRLSELRKFESILREEKTKLGEQCAWVLSDFQVNARVPVPATRMAMQNLCEGEMRKVAREIIKLQTAWVTYYKQNHYDRPPVYLKESFLHTAPLDQRALKLKVVRQGAELWKLRKDRDSMQFEDDLSYLAGLYIEAQARRRDYDRYFVLATRYGHFNEQEFYKDSKPGTRYYLKALTGAMKFQQLWDKYWSVARLKRFRSARMIQACWRCHSTYKKLHPIIKIRMRVGKRTYYMFCWHQWKSYNHICKIIKEAIVFYQANYVKQCFEAWHSYSDKELKAKDQKKRRLLMKIRNAFAVTIFTKWAAYTKRCKHTRIFLRRTFQLPQFDMWVEFTLLRRQLRGLSKEATKIQTMVRCCIARKRFVTKKKAHMKLEYFAMIVLSIRIARMKREVVVMREFTVWEPQELERRLARANEVERRRLQRLQQAIADKEKLAMAEIRRHFTTTSGSIQLRQIRHTLASQLTEAKPIKANLQQLAEKNLLDRSCALARQIAKHDFDGKFVPFIRCPCHACQTICVNESQYHSHVTNCEVHQDIKPFSRFHMMIRNARGQDLLRTYLLRTYGIGPIVNCLDCWASIQDWKKSTVDSDPYHDKAIVIYETYLREDGVRPVKLSHIATITSSSIAVMLDKLETVKQGEHRGVYIKTTAPREGWSSWRYLFGLAGQTYNSWSEDNIVNPEIFSEVEWHCFIAIFNATQGFNNFADCTEHASYQILVEHEAKQKKEALISDYRSYRMDLVRKWTIEFMQVERQMSDRAAASVEKVLDEQCDELVGRFAALVTRELVFEIQHDEQKTHEMKGMVMDEALSWIEGNVLEEVYNFYVSALLKSMWEIPDCRKGMLEYAGLAKKQTKRKLLIDMNVKSQSKEWFDKFMNNTIEEEKKVLPLDFGRAAIRIQKFVRGMRGRTKMRKLFVATFVKRYDSASGACFYVNMMTGESSWERPKFIKHLYPKSSW